MSGKQGGAKTGDPATFTSYEDVWEAYKAQIAYDVKNAAVHMNNSEKAQRERFPMPVLSLLTDDCIEKGIDITAGGARYNWSVNNVAGLSNVVDSFAAVREIVFEKKEKTGAELSEILDRNFEGDEAFRQRLTRCPRFGNDLPEVDDLAADLGEFVFNELRRRKTVRGGRFP